MGYVVKVCVGLAILITTSSAFALNNGLDGMIFGFEEVKCGKDLMKSRNPLVASYTVPRVVPQHFGIPVVSYEYRKDEGPQAAPLRSFDTMSVAFNYYRSEAPSGLKFELVSYERFIYLGLKEELTINVRNYDKVEQDLIERLGPPLNEVPKIADDGKYISKWWEYTQKSTGDALYIGLTDGVIEGKRFAGVISVCEIQWLSIKFVELLMEQQKGNLFK